MQDRSLCTKLQVTPKVSKANGQYPPEQCGLTCCYQGTHLGTQISSLSSCSRACGWQRCWRRATCGTRSREPGLSVLSQPRWKPGCSALPTSSATCASVWDLLSGAISESSSLQEGRRGTCPKRRQGLKTKQDLCRMGMRETPLTSWRCLGDGHSSKKKIKSEMPIS